MRSAVSHVEDIFINLLQNIFRVTISKATFPQIIAWWYARQLVNTHSQLHFCTHYAFIEHPEYSHRL